MGKTVIAVTRICRNNIKRWAGNPRYYVILALVLVWTHMLFSPVRQFSADVGVNVTVWGTPLMLTSWYSHMVLLLGIVLLYCDVPFMNAATPYECIRSGKRAWTAAQSLYIVTAALIYVLLVFLAGVISIIPNIDLSTDWGKVYNTLAQTNAKSVYGIDLPVPYAMLLRYGAVEATVLCALTFFGECCFIGAVMFSVSTIFKRITGTYCGLVLAFLPAFASVTGSDTAYFFMPTTWANLLLLDKGGTIQRPTFAYAQIVLWSVTLVLFAYTIITAKKKRIEVLMPV